MKRRNRAQDTNEEDDELKVNCDEIKTWNLFRFLEEEKKLQFERLNNLQKKLAILRVADLQEILNRERVPFNKYARKDDLQKRMIDVLNNRDNSSSLKERIKKGIIQAYSKMWVGGFSWIELRLKSVYIQQIHRTKSNKDSTAARRRYVCNTLHQHSGENLIKNINWTLDDLQWMLENWIRLSHF